MVYGSCYNSAIDVESIFETLKIDNICRGLKYLNNFKGNVKQTTVSFFNSITIVLFLEKFDKEVNMKVFTDGKVQLSGVKHDQHVICALEIFKNLISDINYKKDIKVLVENNIIYNKELYDKHINTKSSRYNFIYMYGRTSENTDYKIIGERKENKFTIFVNGVRENVIEFCDEYFVQTKKTIDHVKLLFDKNGNIVGQVKYVFRRKRKNITIKGVLFIEDVKIDVEAIEQKSDIKNCIKTISMYDRFNNFTGKQIVLLFNNIVKPFNHDYNFITIKCKAITCSNNEFKLTTFNINCNFQLYLENESKNILILKNVYTYLTNSCINSYYDPSTNDPALNIKFYFNKDDNGEFVQIVNNEIFGSKKDHKPPNVFDLKVSVRIFNTNKISIHGCSDKTQILLVKKILLEMFNSNVETFYKKQTNIKPLIINENISIFDLI